MNRTIESCLKCADELKKFSRPPAINQVTADQLASINAAMDGLRELAEEVQRLENPSPGDTEAQSGAWVAVWKALEKIGLLSFIGSFSGGRVRAVEFIEHIGEENAALRTRLAAAEEELKAWREQERKRGT